MVSRQRPLLDGHVLDREYCKVLINEHRGCLVMGECQWLFNVRMGH